MRALVGIVTVFGLAALAPSGCSLFGASASEEIRAAEVAATRIESVALASVRERTASETVLAARPKEEPASRRSDGRGAEPFGESGRASAASKPDFVPTAAPPESVPSVPAKDAERIVDDALPDRLVLVATSKETLVYARPTFKSPKVGYLRAGAVVSRSERRIAADDCPGGFYEIAPEGFVCAGRAASIDSKHELARAAGRRADRTAALPYVYGLAPVAGAPLYSRIPTDAEQRAAEPDLAARLGRGSDHSFDGSVFDDVPWFLGDGAPSVSTSGRRFAPERAVLGTAIAKTGFAFLSLFVSDRRRFGLTVDMAIVPLDRFVRVEPSRFHGLPLGDADALPVVFVKSKSAALYSGDPKTTGLRFERRLEFREALSLSGRHVETDGVRYLETRDGKWLIDQSLVRVDPPTTLPGWAQPNRTWIDVSILHQTLVAYEGSKPVFVTLVSTGADGTGDPETTHSTIQGQFLIHTKHVTVTMDNDEVGDEFDLRDVPYVQYFKDGYALHAAYWHDGFGAPRSHGCVNLAPLDARYLFAWTEPHVPTAWHGATSTRGTLVSIRP